MNKAFVREPDSTAEYCPRCGTLGQPVVGETLDSHILTAKRRTIGDSACFCSSPQCDVAYFDSFHPVVLAADLEHPVYPKDLNAPICACFGLTCDDIEQDIEEGTVTRTKAALEKAKSPDARCTRMAANGQPCVAYVQKYYLQSRNRRGT